MKKRAPNLLTPYHGHFLQCRPSLEPMGPQCLLASEARSPQKLSAATPPSTKQERTLLSWVTRKNGFQLEPVWSLLPTASQIHPVEPPTGKRPAGTWSEPPHK
ncbi:hypothetical protein ILYODFUR_036059 [Ilyodon furcidens]|uniref:Uncharacterized protein n=1 Tax=Ilyodon furcidens TaxID=33524 RepID=A0ABV0SRY9_9TELE